MDTIPAADWNRMIDELARNQIVGVTKLGGGPWRHPWFTEATWNGSRWEARIKPGFVNGLDPEVQVDGPTVPQATLARLGHTTISARGLTLDARLTESPALALTQWRAVGFDSSPVRQTTEGASYEPIPAFLIEQGATPPEATRTGFERLLRATEIVLFKDRITTATAWTFGTGVDGTGAQFDISYALPQGARTRAYIRTERKTATPAPVDELARLTGDWQDSGQDRLALATVYLLSPPGSEPDSEPGADWTPYVQHHCFWNVTHDVRVTALGSLSDNLGIPRGLGLGVADVTIGNLAARINDLNDQLSEFLRNNQAEGRFWSV